MKKLIIITALIFLFISCSRPLYIEKENGDITYLKAFTHPLDTNAIKTFENNLYLGKKKYLKVDEESLGYYVTLKKKKYNYFLVEVDTQNFSPIKDQLWVRDINLGIVIQNYDNLKIPIYEFSDSTSKILNYITASEVGQILDFKSGYFKDCYVKLKLKNNFEGWVNLRYLCPDMRTTCTSNIWE